MKNYVAIVHKEKTSDYGVSFPDFSGCITAGKTLDEAYQMAHEALSLHAKGMLEDKQKLPKPSSLESTIKNALEKDTIHAYFTVALKEMKQPVRINATFDPELLAAIDSTVARLKTTRSGWLADLASRELQY